ncbi:helix-turn-helix domain-containing protein [Streptomyces sp. KM273126]|uniref:helix-turn-helix domain-containing protein n=1 Tax=Streptomyces sp. KM273126 TaxID=2545247 RepID=UPI001038EAEC|nr:helix-turn-helix transcriptional regulator [Streptomyces sp. KM273126]MBA2807810.1 helix-turn-helix domain-containing protein [Streptomyces sp. KM273126]
MPARSIVTARQQRLGAELRKLRERAGLTAREAARAAGIAESKVSMTEAGRVGVSAERVRHLASQYACDDAALVDALVAMAIERGRGWWEDYRGRVPIGYLDLAELEAHSAHLRTFESVHIPGLLQTEHQVRAIFARSVPRLSEEELETRVQFRLRRQEVLAGLRYEALIHEAALRIRVADRKVAREQLLWLLERSELTNVTIRVVPFDVDGFAGVVDPATYSGGPVPRLDTVMVDSQHGCAFLDAEAQLARYREVLRKVEAAALGVVESRKLIHQLAQDI